ncbi:hypothetical protein Csa_014165 [Cucumis sativus]|uniref:Uncharacterized protein n=1 Tax=Cucumis sativus TaxID=3659 RepID=A0A0A0LU22_CUCSA|nr:hypothetical protein Csa_014165 [Cucumis sativus]
MAPKALDFSSTFEEITKHPTKIIIIIIIIITIIMSSSSSSSFIIITPSPSPPPSPFLLHLLSPNPNSQLINTLIINEKQGSISLHPNPSLNKKLALLGNQASWSDDF